MNLEATCCKLQVKEIFISQKYIKTTIFWQLDTLYIHIDVIFSM